MDLWVRVYFHAVFGGLGGLVGWMLFGIFGEKNFSSSQQLILGGAFIGGFIGYLVVGVEAIRDQSLVRFCRAATFGVIFGALGGGAGILLGEQVNYHLVHQLLTASRFRGAGEVLSRGIGWMLLGVAVGLSEGLASRSLAKLIYGTIGGVMGGFIGGLLFGLIVVLDKASGGTSHVWGGAVGLVILGACIGAFSALVQAVFQPACVKVLRGWQEGREYPLVRTDNILGRDEGADIPLFRDMKVEKRHALIHRDGRRFVFCNRKSPPETTRVNDEPIPQSRELQDGDRIQLGNIVLRFHTRTAKSKEKQRLDIASIPLLNR
jgi:Inner membrane component of T3SS, cytoplasmic domain